MPKELFYIVHVFYSFYFVYLKLYIFLRTAFLFQVNKQMDSFRKLKKISCKVTGQRVMEGFVKKKQTYEASTLSFNFFKVLLRAAIIVCLKIRNSHQKY